MGSAGAALLLGGGGRDQNKMLNPPKIERKSHNNRFLLGDAAPPCFYGSPELISRSYQLSAMICSAL